MTKAHFGPGGNSEAFYAAGYKNTKDAPAWLRELGLNAYEYEAGNGSSAGEYTLAAIGNAAREAGIKMSYHAPYFISLGSAEMKKRLNSIDMMARSLDAAYHLGAETIVVHMSGVAKMPREEGIRNSADTLYKALEIFGEDGAKIGLETMGKVNQLGTVDEVIALCKISPRLVPVVDFGHLNARECGGVFKSADDYRRVFNIIGEALGDDVARYLHCHFSKIEWTKAGEKKHLTFEDEAYGPDFEPLIEAIYKEGLSPTIICESAGSQSEDALIMKKYYERLFLCDGKLI